ncbi:MAG: hypothetical protein IKX74_05990 [Erysipelotrichaceae bacterium]|nr:hypothetical protein [Erysipelotrichaceae bacterium]
MTNSVNSGSVSSGRTKSVSFLSLFFFFFDDFFFAFFFEAGFWTGSLASSSAAGFSSSFIVGGSLASGLSSKMTGSGCSVGLCSSVMTCSSALMGSLSSADAISVIFSSSETAAGFAFFLPADDLPDVFFFDVLFFFTGSFSVLFSTTASVPAFSSALSETSGLSLSLIAESVIISVSGFDSSLSVFGEAAFLLAFLFVAFFGVSFC